MFRVLYFSALSALTSAFMILKFQISSAMTCVHLKRRNMSFRYISESFHRSRKLGKTKTCICELMLEIFVETLFAIFFILRNFFYVRIFFVAHLWQVADNIRARRLASFYIARLLFENRKKRAVYQTVILDDDSRKASESNTSYVYYFNKGT